MRICTRVEEELHEVTLEALDDVITIAAPFHPLGRRSLSSHAHCLARSKIRIDECTPQNASCPSPLVGIERQRRASATVLAAFRYRARSGTPQRQNIVRAERYCYITPRPRSIKCEGGVPHVCPRYSSVIVFTMYSPWGLVLPLLLLLAGLTNVIAVPVANSEQRGVKVITLPPGTSGEREFQHFTRQKTC